MFQPSFRNLLMLALGACLIGACASNRPLGEWQKEGFSGNLDDILVIGVTSLDNRRKRFEGKFVTALGTVGVNAIPSHQLLESSLYLTREIVEKAIRGSDLGAVLVTRLVSIKEKEVYQPPDNQDENLSYFSYYDRALRKADGGTTQSYGVLTLETNLYDTQSGELVWTMQSQPFDATQAQDVVDEYIAMAIKSAVRRGLIAAGS